MVERLAASGAGAVVAALTALPEDWLAAADREGVRTWWRDHAAERAQLVKGGLENGTLI